MLIIRDTQKYLLGQQSLATFIEAMCLHLRTYFPASTALLTQAALSDKVRACSNRAGHYQLNSQRDVCRYLNLAAEYGWEFDRDPNLSWMLPYLNDKSVTDPSKRLELLVKQCLHRQAIAEQNLQLRQQLKPAMAEVAPDPRLPDQATGPMTPSPLLRDNSRRSLNSQAIGGANEEMKNEAGDDADPGPWANEGISLLRKGALR